MAIKTFSSFQLGIWQQNTYQSLISAIKTFSSFQQQQRQTLGQEWEHSRQIWSPLTIQTTHFSEQDAAAVDASCCCKLQAAAASCCWKLLAAAAAASCKLLLLMLLHLVTISDTLTDCTVIVCASKDGVLVQVLPLLFSVMPMQLLVIIMILYSPASFPLYSTCVDQISTPYILEMSEFQLWKPFCWKPKWLNSRWWYSEPKLLLKSKYSRHWFLLWCFLQWELHIWISQCVAIIIWNLWTMTLNSLDHKCTIIQKKNWKGHYISFSYS